MNEISLEMIEKYRKHTSEELRTLLIKKEDNLDKITLELQNLYGLTIPQENYDDIQRRREEIKSIEFIILDRFKSMMIK